MLLAFLYNQIHKIITIGKQSPTIQEYKQIPSSFKMLVTFVINMSLFNNIHITPREESERKGKRFPNPL